MICVPIVYCAELTFSIKLKLTSVFFFNTGLALLLIMLINSWRTSPYPVIPEAYIFYKTQNSLKSYKPDFLLSIINNFRPRSIPKISLNI